MTCQIFNLKVNYMDLQWVCLTQANWIQSSILTFLIFKSGLNMIKFHKIKSYLTLLFLFIFLFIVKSTVLPQNYAICTTKCHSLFLI